VRTPLIFYGNSILRSIGPSKYENLTN